MRGNIPGRGEKIRAVLANGSKITKTKIENETT